MDSRILDLFVKIILEIDEIEERKREFHIDAVAWKSSRPMRDLLLMPLIQIGELTTHFNNNEHMALFPGIPWREIKGFRNIVVHGYGQIDPEIAWNTATDGVKELRARLLRNADVARAYEAELISIDDANGGVSPSEDIRGFIQNLSNTDC